MVLSAGEAQTTLVQAIGKKTLPQRFGGDLEWYFGSFPRLAASAKRLTKSLKDSWTPGPLRFLSNANGHKILAVGTEDQQVRRLEV